MRSTRHDEPDMPSEPTQDTPNTAPTEQPWRVPRETTPVWESELLLSIGLVIGLLQLPGLIDDAVLVALPRFGEALQPMLIFGFLYSKTAIYALVTTFVVHLLLRGFWVAVLGTRAVFPNGVDWNAVRAGRLATEVARRHATPLGEVAERCDNAASVIFAFGFVLFGVTLTILTITLASTAGGIAIAILVPGLNPMDVGFALMGLLFVPFLLAQAIDRFLPGWVPAGGRLEVVLRPILATGNRVMSWPVIGPLMMTIMTRMGRRRGVIVVLLTLYGLIGIVAVEMLAMRGRLDIDGYRHFGRNGGVRIVDPRHYADQRLSDAHRHSGWPFVQSDIVRDPYVRLFIPYVARRLNPAFEERCPDATVPAARDPESEAARRSALLACVGTIFAPTLNGEAIDGLRFDFATDPASGQGGFVAYLPAATLAPGRHELTLRVPALSTDPPASADDDGLYRIPFWR
jgi:hypothetical protein